MRTNRPTLATRARAKNVSRMCGREGKTAGHRRSRRWRIGRFDPRICAFAVVIVAGAQGRGHAEDAWSADEIAVARHCVSERSFADSNDCRVIAWIDQRNAHKRGLRIEQWMARAHTRHLRSASRPWIAELDGSGKQPASWPEGHPWERSREVWFHTLGVVRSVLAGRSHGCDGTPLVWGSPRLDRMRLDRWYARGYARLNCGDTRNEIVGVRRWGAPRVGARPPDADTSRVALSAR